MPLLSAFTMCGHLALSGAPSRGETIYNVIVDQLSRAYDMSVGTHAEALAYAIAMGLARAGYALEGAGNSANPTTAYGILPLLEQDFLITPGANDTVPQRAARVVAAMLVSRGAVRENVVSGLRAIVGAGFLAYVPLGGTVTFPSVWTLGGTQKANPRSVHETPRLCKLVDPVGGTGAQTLRYTNLDPSAGEVDLLVGDVVMVQPENTGLAERVTVSATSGTGVSRTFTAHFIHGHDVGATITTGNWPYWWSTQRFSYVVLTKACAADPENCRKVHEFMAKVARGVSQWAIVTEATGPTQVVGPFAASSSPLGNTPIGSMSFTLSP